MAEPGTVLIKQQLWLSGIQQTDTTHKVVKIPKRDEAEDTRNRNEEARAAHRAVCDHKGSTFGQTGWNTQGNSITLQLGSTNVILLVKQKSQKDEICSWIRGSHSRKHSALVELDRYVWRLHGNINSVSSRGKYFK